MNLNRPIRLLLLMLFVLLQCMAPLAHAHVNNEHVAHAVQRVHIAATDAPWLNDHEHHSHANAVHLSHADHHSAVVCMPPEYRSNALVIDEPALTSIYGKFALREHAAVIVAGFYPRSFPLTPYQFPGSRAPPV
jgi:hypothetical protein